MNNDNSSSMAEDVRVSDLSLAFQTETTTTNNKYHSVWWFALEWCQRYVKCSNLSRWTHSKAENIPLFSVGPVRIVILFVLVSLRWCTWIIMDTGQWCMVNNDTKKGKKRRLVEFLGPVKNVLQTAKWARHSPLLNQKRKEKKYSRTLISLMHTSKHIQDDIIF